MVKLAYRFWVKALAFVLAVVCVFILAYLVLFLSVWYFEGWRLPDVFTDSAICLSAVESHCHEVWADYRDAGLNYMGDWDKASEQTNFRFRVEGENGETLYSNVSSSDRFVYKRELLLRSPVPIPVVPYDEETEITEAQTGIGITVSGYLQEPLTVRDSFYWMYVFYTALQSTSRYALFIGAAALLLFLFLLVYLARASCRTAEGELRPGWQEHIPFDLYLLAVILIGGCVIGVSIDAMASLYWSEFPIIALLLCAGIGLCTVLVLAAWMTLCGRVKLKTVWRHTVIFYLLRLLWKGFRAGLRFAVWLLRAIPLIWKTITATILFCFLLVMAYENRSGEAMLLLAAIASLISCFAALQFRALEKGGKALAAGDFQTKLDTRRLFGSFRRHAENLNSLGEGLSAAVERQLRSERMKTELITNVSHDIKTPLTSIINYADLLQQEHTPEQEAEYLEVLKRQSFRLKKLTEDLVEASKAASGSITVNRAPCSMNELLQQVTGEFAERLRDADLNPVLFLPERELSCFLDGGLMWRMLDNLLTNIVKYAQPGTRVYITLEQQARNALLTFKNVSRNALNIPAEELMERFVRGDASRNTEGNGLGLSITRSLCELQGGVMTLRIDGDLFKAALCFPLMEP